ncbi:aldo/keto reductase [Anaerotalea alkaliphila]|uniref:Aldo/keto reductase n=1 Tax=Anaerotalea alkaliphila TaxID=2662126 RepID=A0A7X5HUN9_9FIRM|nr:aldo/keto reductase [Anaerotalea alkaliphila]NDL66988.1 aldo/keto reductase [Anaerotalea alkaliphila]
MRFVELKKAGIDISVVGLGTNFVGGHNLYNNVSEDAGIRLTKTALELGINYFDTADAYGLGRSEELLGQVLKGRRSEAVVATKGGIQWFEDGSTRMNNRPAYLRQALEDSLRRLMTDHVDIYYIHWPDNETPVAEAVGEVMRLKEEGKVRAIGVSNFSLEQLKEAVGAGDIDLTQLPYSMLDRAIEKDLLPFCVEQGISVAPYGPLAYGILGGRYGKDFKLDPKDWRNGIPLFKPENFQENLRKADALKEMARTKGTIPPNLALAWLLHQEGIDAVIPGAKTPEQVIENAKAADVLLSGAELDAIGGILG